MPSRAALLIALDDLSVRQLMEQILRAEGYEPAIVVDADGLKKSLEESQPELLVIGENFGGQNGLELARKILERFPALPVVLCSGQRGIKLDTAALEAGLSSILHPPFQAENILAAVSGGIARGQRLADWFRREVKRGTASKERTIFSEAEGFRYEMIFANIQGCVIVLDEQGSIVFLNRAACDTFEVQQQDVAHRPLSEAIPHPDLRALMRRAVAEPIKYHEINLDTGQVLNAQFTPIPGIGSAITMQDISYLKEVERLKNDFIQTVSHDLRSPLTALFGYAELIDRAGSLTEQQREFLGRIQASLQHITTLVNDMLDLGRLEAGFDTRSEVVQVGGVLTQALESFEGQAHAKQLRVDCVIEAELPPVRANPIRIRQLLDNLLGNAIKYTPEEGRVHVSAAASEKQVIIEVTDTGPGIPHDEQSQIFEKFYRGSNVSENVRGTGLGLAIVKSIVEGYNGRIWVESAPGRGSSFFVVLPADEEGM